MAEKSARVVNAFALFHQPVVSQVPVPLLYHASNTSIDDLACEPVSRSLWMGFCPTKGAACPRRTDKMEARKANMLTLGSAFFGDLNTHYMTSSYTAVTVYGGVRDGMRNSRRGILPSLCFDASVVITTSASAFAVIFCLMYLVSCNQNQYLSYLTHHS